MVDLEKIESVVSELIKWLIGNKEWLFDGLGLFILFQIIWQGLRLIVSLLQNRKLEKDLRPFFSKSEIRRATKNYISTKYIDHKNNDALPKRLIPFFINNAFGQITHDFKYYIVLADSGMGKTTFLINLYLNYVSKWFRKKYQIRLFPLNHPASLNEIENIDFSQKKNTVLLLDAFDEDKFAEKDHKNRLNQIIEQVWAFHLVVITCRTQFFPNELEEPNEILIPKSGVDKGFNTFQKIYISPFTKSDVKSYLRKKYSFLNPKRRKAFRLVMLSPNLMIRPMLLSYMDDLILSNADFEYTYQIYDELIKKWIEREGRRVVKEKRNKFKQELYKFSRNLALNIYENRFIRNGLHISASEIKPFAEEFDIKLKELDLRSRSLLSRDALGNYKFSHKSILEYFLAKELFETGSFDFDLDSSVVDQARNFYIELFLSRGDPYDHLKFKRTLGFLGNHIGYEIQRINAENNWNSFFYTNLDAEIQVNDSLSRIELQEAIRKSEGPVLMLGAPGAGKSVSLRKACEDMSRQINKREIIPIYVNLQYWKTKNVGNYEKLPTVSDFREFVLNYITEGNDRSIFNFFKLHFDRLYFSGQLFFLLDSFDKIPLLNDCSNYPHVSKHISSVIYKFLSSTKKRSVGILASRPKHLPTDGFRARTILYILPFSKRRVKQAIRKFTVHNNVNEIEGLIKAMIDERDDLLSLAQCPFWAERISRHISDSLRLPSNDELTEIRSLLK